MEKKKNAVSLQHVVELIQVTSIGTDGETVTQYHTQEQLVSVTHPTGDVVTYAYDAQGRKTGLTYPDGREAKYEYDEMDRLAKVTEPDGSVTAYAYDAVGQRIETVGENLQTTYAYDALGNILEQETTGTTQLMLAYAYDALGRIVQEERTEAGETVMSAYRYDSLGQLTGFEDSTGYGEQYTYDAVGNMTRKLLGDQQVTMTYNQGNQLVSKQGDRQRLEYAYDANGNLIGKTLGELADAYRYDALGNLSGYAGYDGYEQTYAYSALGVRTEKRERGNPERSTLEELLEGKGIALLEEGVTGPSVGTLSTTDWEKTSYIQDITQAYTQVLVERNERAGDTVYAYGGERLSATAMPKPREGEPEASPLKTEYVYDVRGSVVQTVLGETVTQSLRYTPFGEQMGDAVSGYTYNGEMYDAATGMLHLRARQYEPAMNRFSQKDVLRGETGNPLSLNRYGFVFNDPVNFVDPDGEKASPSKNQIKMSSVGFGIGKSIAIARSSIPRLILPTKNAIGVKTSSAAASIIKKSITLASQVLGAVDTTRKVASAQTSGLLSGSAGSSFTIQGPGFPSEPWPGASETYFGVPSNLKKAFGDLWGNPTTSGSTIEMLLIEHAQYQYRRIAINGQSEAITRELGNLYCSIRDELAIAGRYGPHDEKLTLDEITHQVPMFDEAKTMYVHTANRGPLNIRIKPGTGSGTSAGHGINFSYGAEVNVHGFYVDPSGVTWAIVDYKYLEEDEPRKLLVQAQHLTGDKSKLDKKYLDNQN